MLGNNNGPHDDYNDGDHSRNNILGNDEYDDEDFDESFDGDN